MTVSNNLETYFNWRYKVILTQRKITKLKKLRIVDVKNDAKAFDGHLVSIEMNVLIEQIIFIEQKKCIQREQSNT